MSAPEHDRMWEDTYLTHSCSLPSGNGTVLLSSQMVAMAGHQPSWLLHGVEQSGAQTGMRRVGGENMTMSNSPPDRRAPRKELVSISRAPCHAHPAMIIHETQMQRNLLGIPLGHRRAGRESQHLFFYDKIYFPPKKRKMVEEQGTLILPRIQLHSYQIILNTCK